MANKLPLVIDANGGIQQIQTADILLIPALIVGTASDQATIQSFTAGAGPGIWIDLPTTGPSGIGTGGAGNNAWLGYSAAAGNWCADAVAGDLTFRNLGGRLLFGLSTGNSSMAISSAGVEISTPATGLTPAANDNSLNFATTAFVHNQLYNGYNGNVSQQSGTTIIPFNSTAPLITGGTQVWSQTITPPAITSEYDLTFSGFVDSSNVNTITIAIFNGNTLIGFNCITVTGSNKPIPFSLNVNNIPGVTTAVTYSCRIGIATSGTWYLGRGSGNTMGGSNNLGWSIKQVV